jgi:hypothetical protein
MLLQLIEDMGTPTKSVSPVYRIDVNVTRSGRSVVRQPYPGARHQESVFESSQLSCAELIDGQIAAYVASNHQPAAIRAETYPI